ncbi:MAG: hypothetical protein IJ109_07215 [Firmicutes bacterium]|nr:hypothetical protein [Bacillota bacterium]
MIIYRCSGIPYSTLNDLACGKVNIDQCRVSLLRKLAEALELPMEEVCRICSRQPIEVHTSYDVDARVFVRHKSYFTEFAYNDESVEIELCRVSEDTRCYIEEIAAWRTEDYIRRRRLEEFR